MSVYRCEQCNNYCDADFEGCYEHPFNELVCICESCHDQYACYHCSEVKKDNKYCKITDQYYCEECF